MLDVAGYHLGWHSLKAEKNAGRVSSITAREVCEMAKCLGMKWSLPVSDVSPCSSRGRVREI